MPLSLRELDRALHIVWPDETLTDDLGVPGDVAIVYRTGATPALYGPKGPMKIGKERGTWGSPAGQLAAP